MKIRFAICIVAAVIGLVALPAPASSQAYTSPKTADGQPDLQGIWEVRTSPDKDLEKAKGVIVEPKNGKIPYLPAALAQKKQNEKNSAQADPLNKCFMPGVPRINLLARPFQIFQTADQVSIAYEYIHNWRNIYLKRSKHLPDIDFWQGDSIGHWENDTLVVDVADFNDQTWLDKAGDFHSEAMHVVERYTRTGPDTLRYEATIEDPKTFAMPWKISVDLHRNTQPNARLMEYECHYLKEAAAARQGK
jgi:hypothetical protein